MVLRLRLKSYPGMASTMPPEPENRVAPGEGPSFSPHSRKDELATLGPGSGCPLPGLGEPRRAARLFLLLVTSLILPAKHDSAIVATLKQENDYVTDEVTRLREQIRSQVRRGQSKTVGDDSVWSVKINLNIKVTTELRLLM